MTDSHKATSRTIVPTAVERAAKHSGGEKGETSEVAGNKIGADKNSQKGSADSDPKISVKVENQDKPSSSDTRPKQGSALTFFLPPHPRSKALCIAEHFDSLN